MFSQFSSMTLTSGERLRDWYGFHLSSTCIWYRQTWNTSGQNKMHKLHWNVDRIVWVFTAWKMNTFIKDLFSKCDQICRKMWIWSHLLKKSFMVNFIFLCSASFYNKDSPCITLQYFSLCSYHKMWISSRVTV